MRLRFRTMEEISVTGIGLVSLSLSTMFIYNEYRTFHAGFSVLSTINSTFAFWFMVFAVRFLYLGIHRSLERSRLVKESLRREWFSTDYLLGRIVEKMPAIHTVELPPPPYAVCRIPPPPKELPSELSPWVVDRPAPWPPAPVEYWDHMLRGTDADPPKEVLDELLSSETEEERKARLKILKAKNEDIAQHARATKATKVSRAELETREADHRHKRWELMHRFEALQAKFDSIDLENRRITEENKRLKELSSTYTEQYYKNNDQVSSLIYQRSLEERKTPKSQAIYVSGVVG